MPFNWCIYREVSAKPSGNVSVGDEHIPRKPHSILQPCGTGLLQALLCLGWVWKKEAQPEFSGSCCDTPFPEVFGPIVPLTSRISPGTAPAVQGVDCGRALHHFVHL